MLDVHIIDFKSQRKFFEKCIETVEEAARNAPYNVNVYIVKGEPHLGLSRTKGFSCGSSPFATYVDNDDYVLPEAFAVVAEHLLPSNSAIFTKEYILHPDGSLVLNSNNRHHLSIFRRDCLIDHSNYLLDCDIRQRASVCQSKVIEVPDVVYVWRCWDSPCSQLRKMIFEKK